MTPKYVLDCNKGIEGVVYMIDVILFCTYIIYLGHDEIIWKSEKENL
jgi:hypothetical protein